MSSYGSSHSGHHHTSHYPPNPHQQFQPPQQPPYPTTPGAQPLPQQQSFYPPPPQQQAMYSSSPTMQYQQTTYSSSPTQQFYPPLPGLQYHPQLSMPTGPNDNGRRSSSMSQSQRPHFPSSSAPVPIQTRPPIYARTHNESHGSHHSGNMHDPHAFADGEDKFENSYGLDEETLRSYEKRYAREKKLERRPTLGGSLMSVFRTLGGKRE